MGGSGGAGLLGSAVGRLVVEEEGSGWDIEESGEGVEGRGGFEFNL